ncbi:ribonuclease 3 [Arenicella chitinivorans]|uniref:Ribonuclease 3 n=1 Tax=Arenicella chitinivorans TaxID=1329800 RepID=A0A918RSH7_9GAMM|nr:ribonuclease III [Arenicella chitinivorans]GHA09069.1 ribonuclease 3 [Arenicella chitinivorans]
MAQNKLAALMRKIGYQFKDEKLLSLAMTHRSKGAKNYERLEFLGDSILGFVVADFLFHKFPHLAEGKLSRMRSSLVRKETLATVARELDMSSYLILGEGELKSGGFNRDSILADTVESLIGALYLDADFSVASEFIHTHFSAQFENISDESTFKDAKSRLQEAMQKRGMSLPTYTIVETMGEQHNQRFTVECVLDDMPIRSEATARSRRLAEQKAAADVLRQVKQVNEQSK